MVSHRGVFYFRHTDGTPFVLCLLKLATFKLRVCHDTARYDLYVHNMTALWSARYLVSRRSCVGCDVTTELNTSGRFSWSSALFNLLDILPHSIIWFFKFFIMPSGSFRGPSRGAARGQALRQVSSSQTSQFESFLFQQPERLMKFPWSSWNWERTGWFGCWSVCFW